MEHAYCYKPGAHTGLTDHVDDNEYASDWHGTIVQVYLYQRMFPKFSIKTSEWYLQTRCS